MVKFSLGRKKQPPKVTVTAPPMTKAQKILGSSALNVDAPQWDEFSSSKVSVVASEASYAPSHTSQAHDDVNRDRRRREWGDDSEVVPWEFNGHGAPTDAYERDMASDMASVLRKRQSSSSTMHSWYDKSKQPLAISQQTSNSAMAKGLPSKAHRMLDMDYSMEHLDSKKKKKPAKLDFSHLMGRSRNKKEKQSWEGPIVGTDQVTRSPSVLSPTSTPSLRGRLSKRPTKESLHSLHSESNRPLTSGSSRRGNGPLNGLPNLYEHYEQMSFRQVMYEGDADIIEEGEQELETSRELEDSSPKTTQPPHTKITHRSSLHPHHDEQVISQYTKRILPQTPQAALASKGEQPSPTDCAASVSSRHTRTSKASKRTDRSFHEDLLEKSVLSLSSDSEDDVYEEPPRKASSSLSEYAASDVGSLADYRPTTSRTTESADNSKRRSRSTKRTSFAPVNNYLAIPNGHPLPQPTINARSSSLSGSSTNTIQEGSAARSPSRLSSLSNSSANTTTTWQSKAGGLGQPRTVAVAPVQEPPSETVAAEPEKTPDSDNDTEPELETLLPARAYNPSESSINSTVDEPTPPLSPSSFDFYIRSAHSSIDGQGSHNRFMAVTHQEEMLLAALRHKRQIMRQTILSELDENVRSDVLPPKGHQSKPSEATITESTFDFDFPAPPTCKDKTTVAADGTTVLDLRKDHLASNNAAQVLPTPMSPLSPMSSMSPQHDDHRERILLYLDSGLATERSQSIEEAEPSPDLSDFYEYEDESDEIVSEVIIYSQQRRHSDRNGPDKRRSNRPAMPTQPKELGVPRPDSPISPNALSGTHRRPAVNKKTARLSAVGPVGWGYED